MPASNVTETGFTVAAGSAFTRADDGTSPRPSALANRYKIRICNTHGTDRLYVRLGTSAPTSGDPGYYVEADGGLWEDFVEPGVYVYVRCSSTNGIYIIFTQYAVS